ncbi:MAG: kelch repeat-containing protein [Elusimicrobiota bacterium]
MKYYEYVWRRVIIIFALLVNLTACLYADDFVWENRSALPGELAEGSAVAIDSKIYLIGGGSALYGPNNSVDVYSPGTDTWQKKAVTLPDKISPAAAVYNDKIYIAGGTDGYVDSEKLLVYDPSNDSYVVKTATLSVKRFGANAHFINGKLYIIGGYNSAQGALNLVEEYDPVLNSWSIKSAMSAKRWGFASAVYNNKIYVFGGYNGAVNSFNSASIVPGVEVYNPAANSWSALSGMPYPKAFHSAAALTNKIYVIGGRDAEGDHGSVMEYDPSADAWTSRQGINTARRDFALSVVNNNIYIFGGISGEDNYLSNTERSSLISSGGENFNSAYCYPTALYLYKGDKLKFANFPSQTKITILSPAGHIIKTIEADAEGNIQGWDCKAEDSEELGTGTYIVHAKDTKNNTKIMKVLVVR